MRVLAASVLVAAALWPAGCGGDGGGGSARAGSAARPASGGYDAPGRVQPVRPAPDFALRDSLGRPVRLSQFRGRAVLLTFIYDHCPDVCPLIVGNLHTALAQLGPRARDVQVVAVSVDPRGDTPRSVARFLAAHEMTGRMEYLIGSARRLARVWRGYGIAVQGTPDSREVSHSALLYGISGKGLMTALYPSDFEPRWIAHDVPILAAH